MIDIVQFEHHSWKMKKQLLGINISFYLEKNDKLYKLQHHVLWDSEAATCINYAYVQTRPANVPMVPPASSMTSLHVR